MACHAKAFLNLELVIQLPINILFEIALSDFEVIMKVFCSGLQVKGGGGGWLGQERGGYLL